MVVRPAVLEMPATEFKAKCLAVMQAVFEGKAAEIVVTKRGKPLARVVPYESSDRTLFGFAAGKLTTRGSLFGTGDRWEAERPRP